MNENLLVQFNGYTFCLNRYGDLWKAVDQRTGRVKVRNTKAVWHNSNGAPVTDDALIAALEASILAHRRAQTPAPAVHTAATNGHSAPPPRIKGRVSPREPRMKGGAE